MEMIEKHYLKNYDRYVKRANRSLLDYHLAEDAVQETYERVLKYHQNRKGDNFDAWFNTVFFNTILKYLAYIREKGMVHDEYVEEEYVSPTVSTESKIIVQKALEEIKLKPKVKNSIEMFLLFGYTADEISVNTGLPVGSIYQHVHKFKKYLRGIYYDF